MVKLGLKVVIFRFFDFFSFLGPKKTTKYFSDFRSKYIKIPTNTSTFRFRGRISIAVAQFYSCGAQSRRFVAEVTWHSDTAGTPIVTRKAMNPTSTSLETSKTVLFDDVPPGSLRFGSLGALRAPKVGPFRPPNSDFRLNRPPGQHQSAFGAPGGASPRSQRAFVSICSDR